MESEQLTELLASIARSRTSVDDDRETIVEAFGDQSVGPLEELDFEAVAADLGEWILAVIDRFPPPPGLMTLHVGLSSQGDHFRLYLVGSRQAPRRPPVFAMRRDWRPDPQEPPIDALFPIWTEWPEGDAANWAPVLAVVIAVVKAFFARSATTFSSNSGLSELHVSCGFDDGERFEVATPLHPAASQTTVVFETGNRTLLALAASMLDDAGIHAEIVGESQWSEFFMPGGVGQSETPMVAAAALRVGADEADRARELLAHFTSPVEATDLPPADDER